MARLLQALEKLPECVALMAEESPKVGDNICNILEDPKGRGSSPPPTGCGLSGHPVCTLHIPNCSVFSSPPLVRRGLSLYRCENKSVPTFFQYLFAQCSEGLQTSNISLHMNS